MPQRLLATRWCAAILAAWFGLSTQGAGADKASLARFGLRDYLGRDWQNELLTFDLDPQLAGRKDVVLRDDHRHAVPFQWVPGSSARFAFLASIPRLGQVEYRLEPGHAPVTSTIAVKEGEEFLELATERAAVRLYKGAKALQFGPIAAVRLASGKWVGAGEPNPAAALKDSRVRVLCNGPVYAEVESEYTLPDKGYWRLRFRLVAGEPVILVEEQFRGPAAAEYVFKLDEGFGADHLFFREMAAAPHPALAELPAERTFVIEPWLHWWRRMHGTWCGFYRADGPDLLAVGLREPACWVPPEKSPWPKEIPVTKAGLALHFQLRGFERKWMFISLPKERAVKPFKDTAPLPQQYLIKYGDFPLDQVKDWVQKWPESGLDHPRLLVTPKELASFRAQFHVDRKQLAHLRQTSPTLSSLDDLVAYALATDDSGVRQNLVQVALRQLQWSVDLYTRQAVLPTPGTAPHQFYNEVTPALNSLDAILGPGVLSGPDRERVRAQLAFLGYTLASPSVHSPERGFSGTANMSTSIRCMLAMLACLIPDHPMARSWVKMGLDEMKEELEHWTGPNGGWLEAPHYCTVSLDAIVPLALALRQTDFTDKEWALDPKLKNTIRWLAAISTPPDPRLAGQRHMPAIGNTYTGERTCLPGWLARIWQANDPLFAQQMQWAWMQQGCYTKPGIGGAYPGTVGYTAFMFDRSIPPQPPHWASECFPEAGAVLRAHFPGDCETYLHLIQGRLHLHYDYDEGSFILWGKGQPLCEDFGYHGRAPAAEHSRVDDGLEDTLGRQGTVNEFLASPRADYLHFQRVDWYRQILLVKDHDCLGPNYFLIRDTLVNHRPADWRVWVATDQAPALEPQPIRVKGRFGADLVVHLAQTSGGALSTEPLSVASGASGFKTGTNLQHSLHLRLRPDATVAAILYPVTRAQATPNFTSLDNGRAVRIESTFGTDYVFVGLDPFEYAQGPVSFRGQCGVIQVRPEGAYLTVFDKALMTYRGCTVTNADNSARTVLTQN